MKHSHETRLSWRIVDTADEATNVRTLFLKLEGPMPVFIPGQYLTVYMNENEAVEGKCYSITSTPSDPYLSITVKAIGNFSNTLIVAPLGTNLYTSTPYGFFFPEQDEMHRPFVFIAGGIGIAPCMSMITTLAHSNRTIPYRLLYANRTQKDIVFKEKLETLADTHIAFRVTHWISREAVHEPHMIEGRINEETLKNSVSDLDQPLYFICGSSIFTRALFGYLRALGVPYTDLYTEGFY